MLNEASYFLLIGLYTLYKGLAPCENPERLSVDTVGIQQYLGKWYLKAAVGSREADIHEYRAMDNVLFTVEETAKDTLLLTEHVRIGDNCKKQTWIYHIHPETRDFKLKERPQRDTVIWSGKWANCNDCIVVEEVEPPLNRTSGFSLNRYMLYARQSDMDTEMVTTFLTNLACYDKLASVKLPQEKEFCI